MNYRIGVDIGGTSVKIGVVDSECNVVKKDGIPTAGRTADSIIGDIITQCNKYSEEYKIDSIGIGSAGNIDAENGIVRRAGNLPFRDEPIVYKIEKGTGIKAKVDNDGSCALLGEHVAGAARGCDDAIIMTIGTGIGGAIMIGGKIYHGVNNRAGELGHFVFNPEGPRCECGLRGCYEQYASATALIRMTKEAAEKNPDSLLAKRVSEKLDGVTPFKASEEGCPIAKKVLADYGYILALGINSYTNIFRPEVTVIAGGIANEKEKLLALIEPYQFNDTVVKITELYGNGGLIGASLLGTEYDI